MARMFQSCMDKTLCQENEAQCRTCGRSLEEIYRKRRLIDELAGFIVDMDDTNMNEFMLYVTGKVSQKLAHLDDQKQQALANGYH